MAQRDSEEEDYREAARSTADYANYDNYKAPQKKRRRPIWRKLGLGLLILAIAILLGGGAIWFTTIHKPAKKPSQSAQSKTNSATAAKISTATKHYESPNFNLGFDYPSNWSVSDPGTGLLTVKSPVVKLKNANGQVVNAKITIYVRDNTQKLPEFDAGSAVAALDSEKVSYTKPSETQRANTYLTFLRYADSNAGVDGVYITGDNGYQKDQAVPKADIQKVDPIISVTFGKCANSTCSGSTTPLSVSADNWTDPSLAPPLKAMLQSFSIS